MRVLLLALLALIASPAFAQATRTEDSAAYSIGYWIGIALFIYVVYRLINRNRR